MCRVRGEAEGDGDGPGRGGAGRRRPQEQAPRAAPRRRGDQVSGDVQDASQEVQLQPKRGRC